MKFYHLYNKLTHTHTKNVMFIETINSIWTGWKVKPHYIRKVKSHYTPIVLNMYELQGVEIIVVGPDRGKKS